MTHESGDELRLQFHLKFFSLFPKQNQVPGRALNTFGVDEIDLKFFFSNVLKFSNKNVFAQAVKT